MNMKWMGALLLWVMLAGVAWADESDVARGLSVIVPDIDVSDIRKTPIEGIFEVTVGPRVVYVTGDGRYVIQGEVLDMVARENLTQPALQRARVSAMDDLGEDQMIVFASPKPKHTITVFSDIDCGYCRKLHAEMDQYLKAGITVRYLLFPRSGIDTPSYDKAVSVWCAKDRNAALTRAKLKDQVDAKTCENPVKKHMSLGQAYGVTGTPAIMTDTGQMLPGYIPAANLSAYFAEQDALTAE